MNRARVLRAAWRIEVPKAATPPTSMIFKFSNVGGKLRFFSEPQIRQRVVGYAAQKQVNALDWRG